MVMIFTRFLALGRELGLRRLGSGALGEGLRVGGEADGVPAVVAGELTLLGAEATSGAARYH